MVIMPSKLHQMLVGLIGRKMRESGYEIVAFHGNEYLFDGKSLNTPPTIMRHKPDLLGINIETQRLCIGEAKTRDDLHTSRTKEQLLDYSRMVCSSGESAEVIVGVPKAAQNEYLDLLRELRLDNNKDFKYVFLPEELV